MDPHSSEKRPQKGFRAVLERKWTFLLVVFVVFVGSVLALAQLNLLPQEKTAAPTLTSDQKAAETAGTAILPERIEIPAIKLAVSVANPTSSDPDVLDEELLSGAVRYPGSGTLGADGQNVIVFGHSSYLPVVHNQAFKAFDGIQNLAHGDHILVTGAGKVYDYEVETVASANTADAGIPLTVEGNKLTLVTCDSFKTKSDRFVVIAHLVESYPATNSSS